MSKYCDMHDVFMEFVVHSLPPKILVAILQREFRIIIELKSSQLYSISIGNFIDSTEINLLGEKDLKII